MTEIPYTILYSDDTSPLPDLQNSEAWITTTEMFIGLSHRFDDLRDRVIELERKLSALEKEARRE